MMMLESGAEREYVAALCREMRLIRASRVDWSVEHVLRFAALLKVDDSIGDVVAQWQIDGAKLFDAEYLSANLECIVTDRNYFPLYKLFYIVNAILHLTDRPEPQRKEEQCRLHDEGEIDLPAEVILGLRDELAALNNMSVVELGCVQVGRMLRNVRMEEESESVRRWGVDGFSLVCILGNDSGQTLRNYFSNDDIRLLTRLSHLFLHLYYYQLALPVQHPTPVLNHDLDDFLEFAQINFDQTRSFHTSQYGQSEDGDSKTDKEEDEDLTHPIRTSEYGVSERGSVGVSQYAESVRGSVIERGSIVESVRGSVGMSEMGSVRGSTRQSMAESVYASSEAMEQSTVCKRENVIAVSSIEDDSVVASLMAVALRLPFNLLNLEPLQRIKICSIAYPFNLARPNALVKKDSESSAADTASQRSESIYDLLDQEEEMRELKVFNLTGAKFGRSPENDFSYPDELSISGKHAQIVFKDESYYLRDLGSKTGTFVYISQRKPLVLVDEQLVQLSYEVEFKVLIIKNDFNEGIIKFEFKKPENEPPYRAILKNNNTVRIGKAENSHIKLTNQSISSYHAQIKYDHGRFLMYDCNTRTGTWLRLSAKGQRSPDRRLSRQDIIRISSKKTFLVQDLTERVEFVHCCDANRWRDAH